MHGVNKLIWNRLEQLIKPVHKFGAKLEDMTVCTKLLLLEYVKDSQLAKIDKFLIY